ncbi:MAG: thioredoxin family protein [Bacteroidales bacterium]|jgi:thiol:disulfide interchange protein DsbD|nr:thioredoxin family protein [Bacteroidales bacterium]
MKYAHLLITGCLLCCIRLTAQIEQPVKWEFVAEQNGRDATLKFRATIDGEWHLYDTDMPDNGPVPTSFAFRPNPAFELKGKAVARQKPAEYYDPNFDMKVKYFSKSVEFIQKIRLKKEGDITVEGTVEFMVCNDQTCLPPVEEDFTFRLKLEKTAAPVPAQSLPDTVPNPEQQASDSLKQDSLTPDSLTAHTDTMTAIQEVISPAEPVDFVERTENGDKSEPSLWWFFLTSFLWGFAAIMTPCVYPMLPMTISYFLHNNRRMNVLAYGLFIIAIYTVVGCIVSMLFGPGIANSLSTHWLPNIVFFAVFVIFAFSLFGMFELVLPSRWVNMADKGSERRGLTGVFFMALTLVLVSFSCTGPIVGMILVNSADGQLLKPVVGMFGYSLAFALPFSLLALFPELLSRLPKSGGWLNCVKVSFGFLELALALKFLSVIDQTYHWGILDREVYLALWIVIFSLLGFYLLGKLTFMHDEKSDTVSVPRMLLATMVFAFVIYMAPGMIGAPLKAISGYIPPQTTQDFDIRQLIREEVKQTAPGRTAHPATTLCDKPKYSDFLRLPHGLQGYFDYEQGMKCARQQNKPVFIDFTGHGCTNCREMEARVWTDPRVMQHLRNDFIIIALYVDDKTELPENEWVISSYDQKMKKTIGKKYADIQITLFHVNAQPYNVLLSPDGQLLTNPTAYNLNPQHFVEFLEKGLRQETP